MSFFSPLLSVCVSVSTDSIHPSRPLRTCSRLCECINIISPDRPLFSEQIKSIGGRLKSLWILQSPLTPGNIPVSASLKSTGASFQKTPNPLLFLSLAACRLSFSPSLPPPFLLMAATLPLDWTRGLLNTSPRSSLHFKVDFQPRARSEGEVRAGKGSNS